MGNKRYAIVRVDNKCPEYTEEDFECPFSNDKIECEICRQRRYGDTKEQLIKKVAQAIRQIADIEGDDKEYKYWRIAVGVVEFLGVEE